MELPLQHGGRNRTVLRKRRRRERPPATSRLPRSCCSISRCPARVDSVAMPYRPGERTMLSMVLDADPAPRAAEESAIALTRRDSRKPGLARVYQCGAPSVAEVPRAGPLVVGAAHHDRRCPRLLGSAAARTLRKRSGAERRVTRRRRQQKKRPAQCAGRSFGLRTARIRPERRPHAVCRCCGQLLSAAR